MGLISKLFKKSKSNKRSKINSAELIQLFEFEDSINSLLEKNEYIPRSLYGPVVLNNENVIEFFGMLKKSGLFEDFCTKNHTKATVIDSIIEKYNNITSLICKHNDDFVENELASQKKYFDNILKDVDPVILLDDDQRRVILTDEDYCLVVAGAGAGKTTTVAAKVKYLVEKKNIDPKQILVVSFTNKAVLELRQKINKDLKLECPIATFHSTGNAIIKKKNPEKLNIVDDSKLYFVLQDYFKSTILKNESTVDNLILFFASYFDTPYEGNDINEFFNVIAKSNYSTMKSEFNDFEQKIVDNRTKKNVTIQSEVVRSHQEVEIANFLYLYGIDYAYEPIYKYNIKFSRKPYTPDFLIQQGENKVYLEHFGLSQDGKNNRYTDEEIEKYKKAINDKVRLHKEHGTKLIYTFSSYTDGKSLVSHLKQELEANGFILERRPNQEVVEKLVSSEENKYIRRLISLIQRFISNFKTNGYTAEDFDRMYNSTTNVRSKLFLNICHDCYLEYQRYLHENNAVDFQDMINNSAKLLQEAADMKEKLDFKYIIVDEYQDISRQRFDLVTALSKVTEAKIIAVGDDWQSIYAFSGSDITLFTHFAEKMGYAKQLKIVKTYRNSQEVIDIAGNFIKKNQEQIQKELKSPKSIDDPVIIYTYDTTKKKANSDNRSGPNYAIAHAVEVAIQQIIDFAKRDKKPVGSILLLGRFGFDGYKLELSGLFEFVDRGSKIKSVKYPKLDITFMTAHASKGLGYDNVIVVNGRNETYGFPSKIEDDPVLSFVIKHDHSYDYAEERRLFYVAMTRTKNRVYFIAPEQNPSEFLLELKHDYKNVVLSGIWNEAPKTIATKKMCPICGYPMQYRYKNAYGLRLYLCTNEPEICGFMTNEPKAGKLPIIKCDCCTDGYLVIKYSAGNDYFLGCTNYNRNGKGCNNVISRNKFYEMNKIEQDIIADEIINDTKKLTVNNQVTTTSKKEIEKIPQKITVIYNGMNLNNSVAIILEALEQICQKRAYGIGVLIDVLRRSKGKKIINGGLHELQNYGVLANHSKEELSIIINWLIGKEFILKTKDYYSVLLPNSQKSVSDIEYSDFAELKEILESTLKQEVEKRYIKTDNLDVAELDLVIMTILGALSHISEKRYYGITTLVNVLYGSHNQKLMDAKLNFVEEYAHLSHINKNKIEYIINWLIDNHFILKTKGLYPVLHLTYEGTNYADVIKESQLEKLNLELESIE